MCPRLGDGWSRAIRPPEVELREWLVQISAYSDEVSEVNTKNAKKKVFISYSWKDRGIAERVKASIPNQYDVWIDDERILPGDSISHKIREGLTASDYYVVLISENSAQSSWVRAEIAAAFSLANGKHLSVVPILLQGSEVPLEFSGLLHLDFRPSVAKGLQKLREFFLGQAATIGDVESRHKVLKSPDEATQKRLACNESLRHLSVSDLRFLVTERLSLEDVEVVWFDLFSRRMSDEVQVRNLALSTVELIDRSRRTDSLAELMDTLCRNFPFINKGT